MNKEREAVPLSTVSLFILSCLIGVICGFGAILFKILVNTIHNFSFNGYLSISYDPMVHTSQSYWGAWIILVPMVGALIVTWLTENFAPEAKGHGVPEVLQAIHHKEGKIRPVVALVKSVASAVSIGTGGAVGREGPMIQIGATFGSVLGQLISMPASQRLVLVAAGASGAISATFNAPLSGLAFAIELMLISINATTIMVVSVTTVTAMLIGYMAGNSSSIFSIPGVDMVMVSNLDFSLILIAFIPFGILSGIISAWFIRILYWSEDFFSWLIKNSYVRHLVGMAMVGVLFYLFMKFSHRYYIEGMGLSTIQDILNDSTMGWVLLSCIFLGKFLATCTTLGSGASGGIFSPLFFLGAVFGKIYGYTFDCIFPGFEATPVMFAIAGMAGFVGSATGAIITAIVITFEMTNSYTYILPIILTTVVAHTTRVSLCSNSIYTLRLFNRGLSFPQGLEASIIVKKRES